MNNQITLCKKIEVGMSKADVTGLMGAPEESVSKDSGNPKVAISEKTGKVLTTNCLGR